MREQKWIAYCWPLDGTQGKHQFAINQSGNVWTTPVADPIVAPAWNALMGGGDKGWSDDVAPEWVPYKR